MDKDLLRDKITEKRHSEWEAIAIGIIGLVLVLVSLFLIFSFPGGSGFRDIFSSSRAGGLRVILAAILLLLGLALMFLGAIVGMFYSHQRSKLMKQLAGETKN